MAQQPAFSTGISIWCPTLPMNEQGIPLRENAGPEERSVIRYVAAMLARTQRRANPIIPTTKLQNGTVAWVIAGRPWTTEEATKSPDVGGASRIAWGHAELGENCKVQYNVIDRPSGKTLWEAVIDRPRSDFSSLLVLLCRGLDSTLAPTRNPIHNDVWASMLPTRSGEALWHLASAMDLRDALELKIQIGDPNGAFKSVERALEADRNCGFAVGLALSMPIRWIAGKCGDSSVAFHSLDRTRLQLKDNPRVDAATAECYLCLDQFDDAMKYTQKFIAATTAEEAARGEELAGRIYDRMKEPAKAAGAFRRAVQMDPHRSLSWQYLGSMAAQLGKWDEAELCYSRAVEAEPNRQDLQERFQAIRAEAKKMRENRGPLKPPSA